MAFMHTLHLLAEELTRTAEIGSKAARMGRLAPYTELLQDNPVLFPLFQKLLETRGNPEVLLQFNLLLKEHLPLLQEPFILKPLQPIAAPPESRISHHVKTDLAAALRGKKQAGLLSDYLDTGNPIPGELTPLLLDALTRPSVRPLAVEMLCRLGATIVPAAAGRVHRNPDDKHLLGILLYCANGVDFTAVLQHLEHAAAEEEFGCLRTVLPYLIRRVTAQPNTAETKEILLFAEKLLSMLIFLPHPEKHSKIGELCLDLITIGAPPEGEQFLEEMLTLAESA